MPEVEPIPKAELIQAARWMKVVLGLDDWVLNVTVGDGKLAHSREGDMLGTCAPQLRYKVADIWLSGIEPIQTLGHEMCHVLFSDLGTSSHTSDRYEFTCTRLGNVLAAAYKAAVANAPTGKVVKRRRAAGKT